MYTNILIDLDNTIFDFDLDQEESLKITIEKLGLNYDPDFLTGFRAINNDLWPRLERGEISLDYLLNTRFKLLFQAYGLEVDGGLAEEIFRSQLAKASNLIPGARATLEGLTTRGIKVYSASNGVYKTQISRLENNQLLDFFSGHFISDQIGWNKPSPKFFQACLDSLAPAPKSSILMVGDNPVADIKGAQILGLDSCLFEKNGPGRTKEATYKIKELGQLLSLI